MRIKRRLAASEFDAVIPFLKISESRITAARMVLVDNKTLKEASDVYEWSRQAVDDAVGAVWKTWEALRESQRITAAAGTILPDGWEQVTLIAPSELIQKFRDEINQTKIPSPIKKRIAKK